MSDEAKPVIVSAVTGDANSDGTVDRLTLTFSESVDIADGGTDNDITLAASTGSASITAGFMEPQLVHWSIRSVGLLLEILP